MKYVKPLKEALSQESIDIILDRISELGWDGISEREKDILRRKDEVDDFAMNFIKVVHNEKTTKRIRIFSDDDIHITCSKLADDDGNMKWFITFKKIPEISPIRQLVLIFNLKKLQSRLVDIFGNNLGDKDYVEGIKNYVTKEDREEYVKILNSKALPIVNQSIANVINFLFKKNIELHSGGNQPYDTDFDNISPDDDDKK